MHFELSVLDFIQSHLRSSFLDTAMPLITTLGLAFLLCCY